MGDRARHLQDQDLDAAMRDALARESSEVLGHQLHRERLASARLSRGDYFVSALLFGIGAGIGLTGVSRSVRKKVFGKKTGRSK